MNLPDVDRLLQVPDTRARQFAARLRQAGLDGALLRKLARAGERLDDVLRLPMRVWHARRMPESGAVAARLFLLHDPVRLDEALLALGDLGPWRDAGLVQEGPEGVVVSSFQLALAGDLFCFGDRVGLGGPSIPPLSGLTLDLARAAMPGAPVGAVLDLGCGAGVVGLLLARAAERVVATDISARALAFTRFNAAMNGIPHVETRQGDLLAACAGERFDRIAAQPPFVAVPPGDGASAYVHGGTRGDEVTLRMLAGVAGALTQSGRAVVFAEWPLFAEEALEDRVRGAMAAAPANALVLQSPLQNLDEHCVHLAAAAHPPLGVAFHRAAIARRDHLEALGVRGLCAAVLAIEPAKGGRPWTSKVDVRHLQDAPLSADSLDRMLAAHGLAHAPDVALGTSRLRVAPGSRAVEQPVPGGPTAVVIHPPAGRPEWPTVFGAEEAACVERVGRAARVLDAPGSPAELLLAARKALRAGSLEVAGTEERDGGGE